MQRVEKYTIHRFADELTVRKYDPNVALSKDYWFSKWASEFAKGDEELEQKLFDENDEMTGLMYELFKKYGFEVYEED